MTLSGNYRKKIFFSEFLFFWNSYEWGINSTRKGAVVLWCFTKTSVVFLFWCRSYDAHLAIITFLWAIFRGKRFTRKTFYVSPQTAPVALHDPTTTFCSLKARSRKLQQLHSPIMIPLAHRMVNALQWITAINSSHPSVYNFLVLQKWGTVQQTIRLCRGADLGRCADTAAWAWISIVQFISWLARA